MTEWQMQLARIAFMAIFLLAFILWVYWMRMK